MKLIHSSLAIALATSTLAAAAPAQSLAPAISGPAAAPTALASTTERLVLARRLVALLNPSETMVSDMRESALQMFDAADADDSETAAGIAFVARLYDRGEPQIRKAMPQLLEAYAQAYAREFSGEDLVQLTAFAQTATGKHYFAKEGLLQFDKGVLGAIGTMMEALEPVAIDLRREMCAAKAQQRIAAGDVKAKCPLTKPDSASG